MGVALALVVAGCAPAESPPPEFGAAILNLEVPGRVTLAPAEQAEIDLPFPCRIRAVRVEPGHSVRLGDPLADLSFPSPAARREVAARAWRAMEAQYRKKLVQYQPRLDDASRRLAEARTAEVRARQALEAAGADPALQAAYDLALRHRLLAEQDLSEGTLYVQRLLDREKRRLDLARDEYWNAWRERTAVSVLKAPFSGEVAAVMAKPGPAGGEGNLPVLVLTRVPPLTISTSVPVSWAPRLRPGEPALVRLPDGPMVEGVLRELRPRDASRENPVTGRDPVAPGEEERLVAVVDLPPEIRPDLEAGQWVSVRLHLRPDPQALSRAQESI